MLTEEENNEIKIAVLKAIPFGETCAWKKEHERVRREALAKRIEDLIEKTKAKHPFKPYMEDTWSPDLEFK